MTWIIAGVLLLAAVGLRIRERSRNTPPHLSRYAAVLAVAIMAADSF